MKLRMATPGPTQVPNEILMAGAKEVIHHRSPQMQTLIEEINQELPKWFRTQNDVYILLSSGTGAMEAAISNSLDIGDKAIVVSNGYFGERFVDICRIQGVEVVEIRTPWGTSASMESIEATYELHPDAKAILVVYSETSTGVKNDIQSIGQYFKDKDTLVIVDAISGLLSHALEMDEWGLDIVLAASHKGFMMPPGLAFVSVSAKAWNAIDRVKPRSYYFSFARYRKFYPMAPSSPGVSLLQALQVSLQLLNNEGYDACVRRHQGIAKAAGAALEALGFELFVQDPKVRSNTVTVAKAPSGMSAKRLLQILSNQFGLTVTGGQGELKDTGIRIGHVGAVDVIDIMGIFGAIEMSLSEIGYTFDRGSSLKAIQNSLAEESVYV
ncbi:MULTISPECIES: pyridoxal-phosphate-dependent aminotransferase family protein [Paenibacillus]|uniref:L-aspartate aminotransferase /phosphoserine aminotransferase n=1 Tax=Paenibacillus pabuli TaxID=1472 RepID=A0A855YHE4_9BACL|nr:MULTISPECIES: alanine--glyoxylate aminotransferase family protein [Paenibacillus]PWW45453.1 L-aspartate aminotransferase /phosphoserine aminotransferase [Paenibacillus pabuli]PXW11790.1 L-aspartate aminotransferase /phosphoserine aminotransferase [Paenibacillus taichungensis]